jgi:hypothetical protein
MIADLNDNDESRLLGTCNQRCIPARGGRIDRKRALGGKSEQIVRSTRLWTGTAQPLASKGLYSYDRSDLVSVHI